MNIRFGHVTVPKVLNNQASQDKALSGEKACVVWDLKERQRVLRTCVRMERGGLRNQGYQELGDTFRESFSSHLALTTFERTCSGLCWLEWLGHSHMLVWSIMVSTCFETSYVGYYMLMEGKGIFKYFLHSILSTWHSFVLHLLHWKWQPDMSPMLQLEQCCDGFSVSGHNIAVKPLALPICILRWRNTGHACSTRGTTWLTSPFQDKPMATITKVSASSCTWFLGTKLLKGILP